jgi:hypothetical protein
VQYNVVLCLCHSVFASRDGITLTKQFEQHGWVATAKSWGRWTAQALVSRAFGRSLMTGVPISMAVQVRGRVGVGVVRDGQKRDPPLVTDGAVSVLKRRTRRVCERVSARRRECV